MAGSSLRSTTRTATSVTMSQMAEQPEETEPKFIIAVDYGTTYTGEEERKYFPFDPAVADMALGVAWTVLNPREAPSLRRVYVVSSWPGARNESKVPSTFTYSRSNGVSNWGHGIGANAFVLRLTKLDLKTPKLGQALSNLEQMLSEAKLLAFDKGPGGRGRDIPHHLTRTSEDVMTEYLRNVLRETLKDIRNRNDLINQLQIPIDLVITHPAVRLPKIPVFSNCSSAALTGNRRNGIIERRISPFEQSRRHSRMPLQLSSPIWGLCDLRPSQRLVLNTL